MIGVETLDTLLSLMLKEGLSSLSVAEGQTRIFLKLESGAARGSAAQTEVVVRSPAIGRFLSAHPRSPDAGVKAGATVDAGAIIGFLQADMILLPVRAGRSGTVTELHAQDGVLLGYGDPILSILAESGT